MSAGWWRTGVAEVDCAVARMLSETVCWLSWKPQSSAEEAAQDLHRVVQRVGGVAPDGCQPSLISPFLMAWPCVCVSRTVGVAERRPLPAAPVCWRGELLLPVWTRAGLHLCCRPLLPQRPAAAPGSAAVAQRCQGKLRRSICVWTHNPCVLVVVVCWSLSVGGRGW